MRVVPLLALVVVAVLSAACAPATAGVDSAELARAFTVTVNGEPAPVEGRVYNYRSEAFDVSVGITQRQIVFGLENKGDETVRIVPDRSVFVLPGGSSSGVITGSASWVTRNDPQPVIIVPSGARATEVLIARDLLRFDSGRYGRGLYIEPIFAWPLTSRTMFRLILSLEVDGVEREVTLLFEGTPSPAGS